MEKQYNSLDLKKAFGHQDYLVLDNKYKQQLINHPLVRNLWEIGHFFVLVANTQTWQTELASGDCEKVSGYSAKEIESCHAEFLFNFGLPEDSGFNMLVTKLVMEYFTSRPVEERTMIFAVYFYRAIKKDGKLIMVQHQAIPLYLDENNIPFIFSNIITDISYLGITNVPHGLLINRFTQEIFHIDHRDLKLSKNEALFSDRELEIMQLLLKGGNSRLIGEQLFISKETVRTHRKNILKKAGLKSTSELIGYALIHGII